MLQAAGAADVALADDLQSGLALLGTLTPTRAMPPAKPRVAETPEDLRAAAPDINKQMMQRVLNDHARDTEVADLLHQKGIDEACVLPQPTQPGTIAGSAPQVNAGLARWRRISQLPEDAILTPRFAKDEGWKWKNGAWERRPPSADPPRPAGTCWCAAPQGQSN